MMKNLTSAILTFMSLAFLLGTVTAMTLAVSGEAKAEDYAPFNLTWTRPTERESGTAIAPDEPLQYQIYCDISVAGQTFPLQLCGVNIEGESFVYILDAKYENMIPGLVWFYGYACDKYLTDANGKKVCSKQSNWVKKEIVLLDVPPIEPPIDPPPIDPCKPFVMNEPTHVQPPS